MADIKIKGLSLEQERAAHIIAAGIKTSDAKVAKAVGVSKSAINDWKQDPKFKVRVLQIFDNNVDLERSKRYAKVNNYLKPVYKEIRNRLREDGALEHVSLKELLAMMSKLHQELRADANLNKSFLTAGIKEYGEEDIDQEQEASDDDDLISRMSSSYEGMRKENMGKKVVRLRS
jgi:hypothetical protein